MTRSAPHQQEAVDHQDHPIPILSSTIAHPRRSGHPLPAMGGSLVRAPPRASRLAPRATTTCLLIMGMMIAGVQAAMDRRKQDHEASVERTGSAQPAIELTTAVTDALPFSCTILMCVQIGTPSSPLAV